jgi:hypothetical protein
MDDTPETVIVNGFRFNPNAGWNGWAISVQGVWYDAMAQSSSPPSVGPESSPAAIGLKAGVSVENLQEPLVDALQTVLNVFNQLGLPRPVITAGSDGSHKAGSKHYTNQAIDIRANNISAFQAQQAEAMLQSLLGSNYYVRYEIYEDPRENHIHIQSPPRQVGELDEHTGLA